MLSSLVLFGIAAERKSQCTLFQSILSYVHGPEVLPIAWRNIVGFYRVPSGNEQFCQFNTHCYWMTANLVSDTGPPRW